MATPFLRANSSLKAASRSAGGSFFASSHAAESVSDAPKPSICWKRWLSSTVMEAASGAGFALNFSAGCGASACIRSGVVW